MPNPVYKVIYLKDLKNGDKVYVHWCDTSASPVWGYDAVIKIDKSGKKYADGADKQLYHKHIDNCYIFLTKQ